MVELNTSLHVASLPGAEDIGNFDYSYLVCHLDSRLFGLPIKEVQEIIPLPDLMRLPQLLECVLGLARYREEIIPVLDIRKLYDKEIAEHRPTEQMVVINHGKRLCGIALHDISEILNLNSDEIEPLPAVNTQDDDEFYVGIKRMGEQIVTLLDLGSILDFAQIPTRLESSRNSATQASATIDRVSVVRLGDIRIGIDIRQIDRITRVPEIKPIDKAPAVVKGIALREGTDSCKADEKDYYKIVDLFKVMNLPEDSGKKSLILSEVSGVSTGFYGGQVDTIIDIPEDALIAMPSLVRTLDNRYIKSVIKTSNDLVLFIDLEEILHSYSLIG